MKDDGAKGLDDRGAPSGIWYTTGRGQISRAVRKAEA